MAFANSASSHLNDPFQSFRFGARIVSGPTQFFPRYDAGAEAGFQSITSPEKQIAEMEYREGTYTYSRFYPGRASFNVLSMGKGVARGFTNFDRWLRAVDEGRNYRVDIEIHHFHRSDVVGLTNYAGKKASRVLTIFNAFPVRYKPSSDFDASSGDVSIQELDLRYEYFYLSDEANPAGERDFQQLNRFFG